MSIVVKFDGSSNYGLDFRIAIFSVNLEGRIAHVAKPMQLEFVPHRHGNLVTPTLTMNPFEGEALVRAFVDAGMAQGLKPPEPHRLEGEIEATKRHLEDLRSLLKLRTP